MGYYGSERVYFLQEPEIGKLFLTLIGIIINPGGGSFGKKQAKRLRPDKADAFA
jgi:hypothetical protein